MKAFNLFDCELKGINLIEASAGTGKTWNICGLYLRLLLEHNLRVDQLLVVTFTNAATAELTTRIRSRLYETLQTLQLDQPSADPFIAELIKTIETKALDCNTVIQRLRHTLHTFDEAAILTIHRFCQRMLTETPFAAGQPLTVELNEDDDPFLLDVTYDFWRQEIMQPHFPALLAQHLSRHKDTPERWAKLLKNDLKYPLAKRYWDIAPETVPTTEAAHQTLSLAYRAAKTCWETYCQQDDGETLKDLLTKAASGLNAKQFKTTYLETARAAWSAWLNANQPYAPIEPDKHQMHCFCADFLCAVTKQKYSPPSHPFFDAAATLLETYRYTEAALDLDRQQLLQRFLSDTTTALRQRKRKERQTGFDDILWNAYAALSDSTHPWLAQAVHTRYPAALIDEFQDTDPLQLAIFNQIYNHDNRHGTLFLVGDPKQAIYSFRSADLFTYLSARQHADTYYTLNQNQRSSPALIRACNRLFSANSRAFMLEGLDYHAITTGQRSRSIFNDQTTNISAALQLWQLPCNEQTVFSRDEALHHAAAATAGEIARLLNAGQHQQIQIDTRPLAPSDIAVLVRSHSQGARMRQALAEVGIDSVELSQASVYQSEEAEELERILLAILEPHRLNLVMAALATTAMGWDATQLALLQTDEPALSILLERFNGWRDEWLTRGFGPMIRHWMAEEGVAARLLTYPNGERRLTNLLHLTELLQKDVLQARPEALLRHFAYLRHAETGEAAQLRLESDRNLVQITTVHRAKGLEYNIVFCPFLFDAYTHPDNAMQASKWHDDEGTLILDYRLKRHEEIRPRIRLEQDAETLRLIYVALTRAVHRCYLVIGHYGKKIKSGYSFKESNRNLLNWLAAGQGYTPSEWHDTPPTLEIIDEHWLKLATSSEHAPPPDIVLSLLPQGPFTPFNALTGKISTRKPLLPPATPQGWFISSFSALSTIATSPSYSAEFSPEAEQLSEISASDRDSPLADTFLLTDTLPPAPLLPDDILYFPRGINAGDCFHTVFELADFSEPSTWPEAIQTALAHYPQTVPASSSDVTAVQHWPSMLHQLLSNVTTTFLNDTLRLCDLSTEQQCAEMGFYLPVSRLSAETLNVWLKRNGYPSPTLNFAALKGYLKGYIDLVFKHNGQFFILDWKSNYLGLTPQDYASARLNTVMAENGYHLQHLIYTIAIHRHLQSSLPDYDYERHFGGVFYLFVRGVRPQWQWDGRQTGVFFHRASAATLSAFDHLLKTHSI